MPDARACYLARTPHNGRCASGLSLRESRVPEHRETMMENIEREELPPTVEQLEIEWWEPLSCKCDIDFEEE